jgi:hypothetical protein
MAIKRIHSGGAYEPKIGYCRALVAGGFVHVSGTVGVMDRPMWLGNANRRWA